MFLHNLLPLSSSSLQGCKISGLTLSLNIKSNIIKKYFVLVNSICFKSCNSKISNSSTPMIDFMREQYRPNVPTTPLRQWGFRQCLPFSWTTLRGKYCRHPIAVMGVVDTFGRSPVIGCTKWWRSNILLYHCTLVRWWYGRKLDGLGFRLHYYFNKLHLALSNKLKVLKISKV